MRSVRQADCNGSLARGWRFANFGRLVQAGWRFRSSKRVWFRSTSVTRSCGGARGRVLDQGQQRRGRSNAVQVGPLVFFCLLVPPRFTGEGDGLPAPETALSAPAPASTGGRMARTKGFSVRRTNSFGWNPDGSFAPRQLAAGLLHVEVSFRQNRRRLSFLASLQDRHPPARTTLPGRPKTARPMAGRWKAKDGPRPAPIKTAILLVKRKRGCPRRFGCGNRGRK